MAHPWARLANFLGRAHPQPWSEGGPSKKKFTLKSPDKGGWPSPGPDWPISWGEHTLSPSLRVVPQKKISLKNPDKGGWPSPGPDWPISWGEHTLSPGLRVVHQKKILPSKVQTRVDGPALGQTELSSGESARSALVRR